jgi:hypothetical protein
MHPNVYLRSLWRSSTLDQVFVAMSFEDRFHDRFLNVIRPAIEDEPIGGGKMRAFRVDTSKNGDSILTEIIDGIAHSRLVLADVSVVDEGRYTEQPIRNGNVMYEVGLALACRTPAEVLLLRDDTKRFLFDVSSIPHLTVDFADRDNTIMAIRAALNDRARETDSIHDARVQIAVRSLTQDELRVLTVLAGLKPNQARHLADPALESPSFPDEQGIAGLLNKGCIRSVAVRENDGVIYYSQTPFGRAVLAAATTVLDKVPPPDAGTKPQTEKTAS